MSIKALDEIMGMARPDRLATIAFVGEGGETRVAWGYVDRLGKHHRGVVHDFAAAERAAAVHGFTLNGDKTEAPVAR